MTNLKQLEDLILRESFTGEESHDYKSCLGAQTSDRINSE